MDYKKEFIKVIKKYDAPLYGVDIYDEYIDGDEISYTFSYQIDDRKDRLDNSEIEKLIEKELIKKIDRDIYVSVTRMDAYPDGNAHYHVSIDIE